MTTFLFGRHARASCTGGAAIRASVLSSIALLNCVACSGGSGPVAPAPAPPIVPATPIVVTGHLSATNGGQALANTTVAIGGAGTTTSDSGGTFRATLTPGGWGIDVSADAIIPRHINVNVSVSREIAVDAFVPGSSFDLSYYRKIGRNGFDEPTNLQPIRHLTQPASVYLRTIDDAGQSIDATTLNVIENTIRTTDNVWSGGRYGIVDVVRGTETRAGVAGWLTVRWLNPPVAGICGRADVGAVGGLIELNPLGERCGCGGSRIQPETMRHELGHAFGLYHTDDPNDVMWARNDGACDKQPSARERAYANYVYSRPFGNLDPDTDTNLMPLTAQRVP